MDVSLTTAMRHERALSDHGLTEWRYAQVLVYLASLDSGSLEPAVAAQVQLIKSRAGRRRG